MLSAVTVQATNYTDVDILNFALNLEVCVTTNSCCTSLDHILLTDVFRPHVFGLSAKHRSRPELHYERLLTPKSSDTYAAVLGG